MHFVEYLPLGANALPIVIRPFEISWIDYLRRAMWTLRLKTRGGVRIGLRAPHQPESVQHPCVSLWNVTSKVALILRLKSGANLLARGVVFRFQNHVHILAVRCPHSEMHSSFRHYLRTNRQMPRYGMGRFCRDRHFVTYFSRH